MFGVDKVVDGLVNVISLVRGLIAVVLCVLNPTLASSSMCSTLARVQGRKTDKHARRCTRANKGEAWPDKPSY